MSMRAESLLLETRRRIASIEGAYERDQVEAIAVAAALATFGSDDAGHFAAMRDSLSNALGRTAADLELGLDALIDLLARADFTADARHRALGDFCAALAARGAHREAQAALQAFLQGSAKD